MVRLKKIGVLLAALLCMLTVSYTQILVTPQIPPQGLLQKKQLWNILVINNSGIVQPVQIQMSLSDRATGQKLLNGTSRTIALPQGASQFREQDFAPIQYNFSGSYAAVDRNTGDMLMAGAYTICYTLISHNSKGIESPMLEECVQVDVEPLSPPQLISPADTSVVETSYPYFNWIPPAPAVMFSDLKYEIIVVELKNGQSPYEAIQRNAAIYIQRYLTTPYLLYPASYKTLEPGKKYVWQVIAKNGNLYSQKTEAWSFAIKEDSAATLIDAGVYVKLRKGYDAHNYICKGNMHFEYNNETGDTTTTVSIYTITGDQKQIVDTREVKLKQGQNFIDMKIGNTGKYQHLQAYLLEIVNNRKENWNLKFKYVKKED